MDKEIKMIYVPVDYQTHRELPSFYGKNGFPITIKEIPANLQNLCKELPEVREEVMRLISGAYMDGNIDGGSGRLTEDYINNLNL